MKLFDRIEQLKNEEEESEEPEVIVINQPTTKGQKWFEKEALRRRDELNERTFMNLDAIHHQCENAKSGRCKGPVTYGPDPYRSEINNDNTPVWECEECRYQSRMDI
jgi:hypothetical protein